MRTVFKLQQPDTIEATMTITMPLNEWKALRTELSGRWPSSRLSDQIDVMVSKAEQIFVGTDEDGRAK